MTLKHDAGSVDVRVVLFFLEGSVFLRSQTKHILRVTQPLVLIRSLPRDCLLIVYGVSHDRSTPENEMKIHRE